jgi:AraC-like DNA-binding protein
MPAIAPLTLADAALRGAAVMVLLLLGIMMRRDRPRAPVARIGSVFVAGLVVQVVSSTPAFEAVVPRLLQAPLVAVSVGNAVLFWLFVLALFDDDFVLRPWHVGVWLAVAAISAFNCATGWRDPSALGRILVGLQRSVPLACAALAAVAAAATWRLDLVEKRRRLRKFIVVAGTAYTLAMLAARLASPQGRLSDAAALLDVAALLAMLAIVAIGMLRMVPSELFPEPRQTAATICDDGAPAAVLARSAVAVAADDDDADTAPVDPAEERLAAHLQRLMADECVYRVEGLTVAGLAHRLGVPEYRLRRHIHQRLGHRNFNAYVNAFRLDEARSTLADPARRALPVLTIALDAGFQSIGPFNRAFKAATGSTPTEFRRRHLADS